MAQPPIHILLLEDDPSYLDLLRCAFDMGDGAFQISAASSLASARALLEVQLPDLVIAEWELPDGCAIELVSAPAVFPSLAMIVLTRNSSVRPAVEAMKAGALDYLTKSEVTPDDLPQIVRRTIREHARPIEQLPAGAPERALAEELLRVSEQRFRTLIHDLHVGVLLQGPQAEILHCNQAALDLLGLSEDQLLGKTSFDPAWNVIREDGSPFPGPMHPVPQALATRQPVRDVVMGVYRPRSGDRSWLLVNAEPQIAPDGEVRQVTCSFSDITARRLAELAVHDLNDTLERRVTEQTRELRQSAARYRQIVETAEEGIWLIDGDNITTFVNQKLADMLGYGISEMIDLPLFAFMDAEGQPFATANVERRRQGSVEQREFKFVRKDGANLWTEIATNPFFDDDGAYSGALAMVTDITERRRMSGALEDERRSLAQRVEARTAELRAANAELARAARLKDEFMASMSHELRTPLNTILGMSETILERIYGPLTDEQADAIQSVAASGRHLLALINDILDLSKIEAGQLILNIAPVAIEDIAQSCLPMIKQPAQQKRLTVSLDCDSSVENISADPRRLKQMLINLLSNAVKFTPAGGSIGLKIAGDMRQGVVRLTVWDTGIGIAQADIEQLFRSFIQLDGRLSRQYMGTGLGLVLVARLAALHGGSVAVESTLGQGSRFTIVLPWQVREQADAALADAPVAGDRQTHGRPADAELPVDAGQQLHKQPLILLADDNDDNRVMLSKYLRVKGYQVLVAQSGAEVIERARELRPDLILMDIQMPGIDGVEATRRIRSDAILASIPIIALTATAMSGDRERCLAAGMSAYLSKPINLHALAAEINKLLGGSQTPALREP